MRKDLYWLNGPWPGKVAMAPRPRGGDWLEDDLSSWKREGVDLGQEAGQAKRLGMEFVSFPIPDRQIPNSEAKWADLLERVTRTLSDGKNVVVHCRQGIGRSGLVAACLLVRKGISPGAAVEMVSAARGVHIPETLEQRDWIDHYAVGLSATK
jgi:hypothetical protein